MKYDVTFSCGHTAPVELFGPGKERERKISWYETHGECPECYKARKQAEREEANARAAQEAEKSQWPELVGTPKQVAWANTIRKEKIDELMTLEPTEKGMRYIAWIVQTFTTAKYWIDNRDESLRYEWKWGQDVFNAYEATRNKEEAMKYKMEYACGHTTTVDCTMNDCDHMRELIGRTYCPECWEKQTATGNFTGIQMSRAEHDAYYWSCKIKPDSYDSKTDTVVVNVFNDLLAERTKIAELMAQSAAIEGMDELRAIRKVWSDYRAAFNRWREEGCEGNPPAAPAVAITDIAAKYPRAAAFVEAEDFSRGADDTVCTMCRKAMEKILRGEDYTKAIEEMHREWNNWNPLEEARKWILAEGQKKSAGGTE